ncbi:ABC transporter substrate-binding protein [Salinibacterium sp. SWN1162]|uniref:ABC transporter substrate-binding protein n=1 Tax=Salinibacterium sp. SWN1162 TaxID=2792053 RepID=UPI0018CDBB74|nr:ABC transporter substrate-binding protein [Salinibacterium sp. SWN1162]MBH0007740.1 ABC transporter substrate-binding protein [Salinibacterium sp. SWN1162]
MKRSRIAIAAVATGAVVALTGCATSDPTDTSGGESTDASAIVVGSFAYPESEILGNIYALALEDAGFEVETKFNLGPRQTTIPALEDGSISLMPEYNGNLLFFYDTENEARTTADVDTALETTVPDGFRVLDSSPAEDKDAYVVTQELADAEGLVSIGDLKKIEPFSLGASPQIAELPYGIPGLEEFYGLKDITFVPIEDFGGPDTVKALVDDAVQVADIFTTSPDLVAKNLLVLDDPENLIAAQNIVPLLNSNIYSDELAEVLNRISAELTTDDLIALRDRVEGTEKAQAATAAMDWLTDKGLLG